MPSSINTTTAAPSTPAPLAAAAPAGSTAARAPAAGKPDVIASRRRCEADGVGLSHYILMDRKAGR